MNPIFVAIDTADLQRARELAIAVRGAAGGLKLGLEFFSAHGATGVAQIKNFGLPIFLDVKLHDIPNTVAKAVEALRPLRPAVLTVHASGGRAMLEAAKAAAGQETKVVAVTVLTSLDESDLEAGGVQGGLRAQVIRLAQVARTAGVDGIVCSGAEVAAARAAWPEGFFVVPGIRPQGSDSADQKRVVTPRRAMDDGASLLVLGRAVTGAADPRAAVEEIAAALTLPHEPERV
jgi:orotidine-5'-phosphate decarboxylase